MKQTACKLCREPFVCDNGMWFTTCECAKLRPEELKAAHSPQCTGVSAHWCPVCGDCTCKKPEDSLSDDGCPLHDIASKHALPELNEAEKTAMLSLPDDFVSHLLVGERARFYPDGMFSHWEKCPEKPESTQRE